MRFLQIDDDEDDLEIFGSAVELFDPAIVYHGVRSFEEAFSIFRAEVVAIPDIIFLDINMPRYSGFDCYARFKKDTRFNNTRYIFLSTTIFQKEIPVGSSFMKKQDSLKAYVTMLKNVLPQPL